MFSVAGAESVFTLGIPVSTLMVPLLARRRQIDSPYFSRIFAIALCPFMLAAVVVLLRLHSMIEHEDLTPSYVVARLRFPRQILVFGGAATIFSIAIYSAIYAASQKFKRPELERPIPDDRKA